MSISATSLSTITCFLCFSTTNVMPLKAFCFYAALSVFINYLITLIMFPPMLVFNDKYLAHRLFCINFNKSSNRKKQYYEKAIVPEEYTSMKFFGGFWNTTVRKIRWLILLITCGWCAYAGFCTKDLKAMTMKE